MRRLRRGAGKRTPCSRALRTAVNRCFEALSEAFAGSLVLYPRAWTAQAAQKDRSGQPTGEARTRCCTSGPSCVSRPALRLADMPALTWKLQGEQEQLYACAFSVSRGGELLLLLAGHQCQMYVLCVETQAVHWVSMGCLAPDPFSLLAVQHAMLFLQAVKLLPESNLALSFGVSWHAGGSRPWWAHQHDSCPSQRASACADRQ